VNAAGPATLFAPFFGAGNDRRGEFFVEGEKVSDALASGV